MQRFSLPLAAFALAMPATTIAQASFADRAFLQKASQGADYELALARTATIGASNPEVRAYAQRIVKDHDQANVALTQLLKSEAVPVPAGMAASDSAKLAKLKALRGRSFDKRYVDEVTRINMEDEKDTATETRTTRDARIKAYLGRFSRMDAEHKRMGEQLKTKVG